MASKCLDCGYKHGKRFPGGKCPACDSFNIKSTHPALQYENPKKERKTFLELILLALLIYGFWDKYLQHWL